MPVSKLFAKRLAWLFAFSTLLARAEVRSLSQYGEKAGAYAWVEGPAHVREKPDGRLLFSIPDGAEVRLIRPEGSWWEVESMRKRGFTHRKNLRTFRLQTVDGRFEFFELGGAKISENIGDRPVEDVRLHALKHPRYFALAEFPSWEMGAGALVLIPRKGRPVVLHGQSVSGLGARLGGFRVEGIQARFRADFGCVGAQLEYVFPLKLVLDTGKLPRRFDVQGRPRFVAVNALKVDRVRIAPGEAYFVLAWDSVRRAFEVENVRGERMWVGHEELERLAPQGSDASSVLKRYCAG